MDKSTYYAIKRRYHSILTFHDHQFWDLKQENAWELHGDQILTLTNKGYNIKLYGDQWAVRFDQDRSRFHDIIECHPRDNCMSVLTTGGYLEHRTPIGIENNYFTIGCWIRIRGENALQYTNSENYDIVLCGWDTAESGGNHIQVGVLTNDSLARKNTSNGMDYCIIKYTKGSTTNKVVAPYRELSPILTPGTWHYFSYQHLDDHDYIHLDGRRVLETSNTFSAFRYVSNELYHFKLGAYTDYCSGGLDIDEFIIVNDFFGKDDYPISKDKRIYWTFPEMYHEEELDLEDNIYYKTGSMFGLHYVQLKPTSQSGSTLTFNVQSGDKVLGLFMNNTYMDPSRYSGSSTITLNLATDKALISSATFTLVVLRPNNKDFYLDIRSLSVSGSSFSLPYIAGKTTKDDFIILDGSLGVVQRERYRVEGSGTAYTVKLNNPHDTFGGGGTNIHIIFLRKNSGTTPQIKFFKLQGIADPKGYCTFPPEFNYIGYSKRNILLFVNGTYLPPDHYELKNGRVKILNDTQNLEVNNNVTALFMISNEKMGLDDEMLSRINGASEWDTLLDNLRITRPTYWQEEDGMYGNMYNKIKWYKNNKIPASNFIVIDEFDIEFKE